MSCIIRDAVLSDVEAMLAIYAPYVEQTAITFEYDVPTLDEFRQRLLNVQAKYPWITHTPVLSMNGQLTNGRWRLPSMLTAA